MSALLAVFTSPAAIAQTLPCDNAFECSEVALDTADWAADTAVGTAFDTVETAQHEAAKAREEAERQVDNLEPTINGVVDDGIETAEWARDNGLGVASDALKAAYNAACGAIGPPCTGLGPILP